MRRLALALRGLTADEIGHVVSKVFAAKKTFDEDAFCEVLAEKEQMSRKEGVLEFVPPRFSLEDVGGYAVLKALAAEAAGALLEGCARRGHPDPQGHPPDGDLGLREEPVRQDDLDALEPAALPPRHERGLRNGQPRDDVSAGAAGGRGRLAGRALDRRDRDGRRRLPGRAGRLDVAHLLGLPDLDAGEEPRSSSSPRRPTGSTSCPPRSSARAASTRSSSSTCRTRKSASRSSRIHLKKTKLRRRALRPRLPRQGDQRLERRRDRAGRHLGRRRRLLREAPAHRGRPLPDDLGDRAPRRDDGGADQGDPQLGARAGAERLADDGRRAKLCDCHPEAQRRAGHRSHAHGSRRRRPPGRRNDPGIDCGAESSGSLAWLGMTARAASRAGQFLRGPARRPNGARNRSRPLHSRIRPVSVSKRAASESVSRSACSSGGAYRRRRAISEASRSGENVLVRQGRKLHARGDVAEERRPRRA